MIKSSRLEEDKNLEDNIIDDVINLFRSNNNNSSKRYQKPL